MKIEGLKVRILAHSLIVFVAGMFTFCADNTTEESTHFVYKAEGIPKGVQSITGLLQTAVQYDHKEQSLVLTASNSFSETVTIKITNWDFQNPPEGGILADVYDATYDAEQGEDHGPDVECIDLTGDNAGTSLCSSGLITFMMDGELYTSVFTGNEEGTITITECDPENLSVSGSFSVKVQAAIGNKLKLTGTFTNVKYTVF